MSIRKYNSADENFLHCLDLDHKCLRVVEEVNHIAHNTLLINSYFEKFFENYIAVDEKQNFFTRSPFSYWPTVQQQHYSHKNKGDSEKFSVATPHNAQKGCNAS